MSLSVTDPVGLALERTKKTLFRPFDLAKWFKLGFCAFLVELANCSGNSSSGWDGGEPSRNGPEQAKNWIIENADTILVVGSLVGVVVLAFWLALVWLQSRGRFMFLDGVVNDRGAVVEPWKEYRSEGNSLFAFAASLNLLGALLGAAAVVVGLILAWPDIEVWRFADAAKSGLIAGGCSLLLVGLVVSLANLFLNDFVVPAMYARRVGVLEAWGVVTEEIFGPHLVAVILYVVMKVVIAIATAVITFGIICVTLCLAACVLMIPYIGTVALLPFFVFNRCYSLAFVEQLGDRWILRPAPEVPEESGW